MIAVLITSAFSLITILIDGLGNWSNSNNFKETKTTEAVQKFTQLLTDKIKYINIIKSIQSMKTSDEVWLVIKLNAWSIYINSNEINSKYLNLIIGDDIIDTLSMLYPVANRMKKIVDVNGFLKLCKTYSKSMVISK